MTHEEARDVLPLYALGVTDTAERAQLEEHLRGCLPCQQVLALESRTVDGLGRSVDQVRPRPELRRRVLGNVRSFVDPDAIPDAGTSAGASRATPWFWAVAAAAVVALVTSIGLVSARRELAEVQAELETSQQRVAQAEERAVRAASEATSQRRVVTVLTSTDLIQATLNGEAPAASARARAFLSASTGTLIFTAYGLPALPAGRVYQLWAIVGTTPVSAGVFTPDADGRSQFIAQLPALDAPPATIAVTLEPAGGVPKPTGPMYLVGAASN
ncbi:MAG: anti-sigma factor [Acidobacteria bacterium]|nr:anti-sigma factor [Acidobacteriota bacterium]